ncbi:MAG: hypothetical protein LBJ60_07580 [Tannerellaceae bacterium]|jgi:D-alanyl-lipoteichoic acid acyltransferase DltB (MBOAT superfamily)|nr:hypothetical protein [Tannerellaceae bacterium]
MTVSFIYIVILIGISIALYYSTPKAALRNSLLLSASLFFYYAFEGEKVIMLLTVILTSFFTGKLLCKNGYKKYIFAGGILINILLLLTHKYTLAAISNPSSSLPVGLSFYTFQSIGYIVDIQRKKDKEIYTFIEVATFIAFFPKLLAGPLERVDSFVSELRKKSSYNGKRMFKASKIIIFAFVCKFVFADNLGYYIDNAFQNDTTLSSINIFVTATLFSFQLFFDFYAYSILAIGIALLYGIKLSVNFNYPYFSSSFHDFWKRWNITLTSWFRDYIYIPLGGDRVSDIRWALNVMIVFLISGAWHGGAFNYILWGFLHGILYITERYSCRYLPDYYKENKILIFSYRCFVFIALSLLWLIFRIENSDVLIQIFKRLFLFSSWDIHVEMAGWLIFTILCMLTFTKYRIIEKYIFNVKNTPVFILKEIFLINLLIILLLFFSTSGNGSFIYFKF